jgi:hypothetical protein
MSLTTGFLFAGDRAVVSPTMDNMSAFETLLQYIRQSEPLIVVTFTLTVAGLALFAGQRWEWRLSTFAVCQSGRPAAVGVWTVCAVHVAVRTVIALWKGATTAARFIAGIPQRRQRAAYGRPIIERLRATDGVEREGQRWLMIAADRAKPLLPLDRACRILR